MYILGVCVCDSLSSEFVFFGMSQAINKLVPSKQELRALLSIDILFQLYAFSYSLKALDNS